MMSDRVSPGCERDAEVREALEATLRSRVAKLETALFEILAWAEHQANVYASLDPDEPAWTPDIVGVHDLREILSRVGFADDECACADCTECGDCDQPLGECACECATCRETLLACECEVPQ